MAAVWQAVVRRVHDADHWQLGQGGHPWGSLGKHWVHEPRLTPPGFVAFDQYKRMLADADGKMTGPRTVLAGFGAGVTESLLAVTPTESIKTTLYSTPLPS